MSIPQGCGEHALAGVERSIDSPTLHRSQKNFGVGSSSECRSLANQSATKVSKVVDLTVVGEYPPPIRRRHRLMTLRAQIDNGQPLMSERRTAILVNPQATVVGAPVAQGGCHVGRLVTESVRASPPLWVQQTSDATHQSRTSHVRARAAIPQFHSPPVRLAHGCLLYTSPSPRDR